MGFGEVLQHVRRCAGKELLRGSEEDLLALPVGFHDARRSQQALAVADQRTAQIVARAIS